MIKAVFIDRDGVVTNNAHHYYIFRIEDMVLVDEVAKNLKTIQQKGYLLFMVTNQGGIAKGQYTLHDVNILHSHLQRILKKEGVEIKDIAVCPHHSSLEKCLCRKPEPLMLEKLIARYHIDVAHSFFIGDSETDMLAAQKAGVKGIKIEANRSMSTFLDQIPDVNLDV